MKGGVTGVALAERRKALDGFPPTRVPHSGQDANQGRNKAAKNLAEARPISVSARLWPVGADVLSWKAIPPPDAGKASKGGKSKQLNAATISRLSKKLIAREWANAMGRGRSRFNQELAQFERRAAEYHQEKEKRRKLEARARRRARRLIHSLQESLSTFARSLCQVPPEERASSAEKLLRESLRPVGDVDHIHWSVEGCQITFEPWVERQARRKSRASLPALFRARVDDQLRVTGCVPLEGEEHEVSRRESIVDRVLTALRRHGRTLDVLQDALGQVGRIVRRFTMNNGGIKVSVEPWEEVRRRRLERRGRPPIKAYVISADPALENIRCEPC